MSVGLHILYGVMGSGKTNYAVNELLAKTTYKNVICNIPLSEEFKTSLSQRGITFTIFEKTDPKSVIEKINSDNPQTFFIVDESQLCLTSANASLCKSFAKRMSQIRQDDQDVNLIAQTSKMLPSIIKEVATDCYKFVNNNEKGIEKSSSVEHFTTGFDYQTRKTEDFKFKHVYGNYVTSNWETTEKPKNLYRKVYIKLSLIAVVLLFLVGFILYKVNNVTNKYEKKEPTKNLEVITNVSKVEKKDSILSDSLCVRSWHFSQNAVVYFVLNSGESKVDVLSNFSHIPKCPLP